MTTSDSDQKAESTKLHITTSPVMLVLATTVGIKGQPPDSGSQKMRALDIPASLDVHWLCINDITGSSHNWVTTQAPKSPHWSMHDIFMDSRSARIFDSIHGSAQRLIVP